MIKYWLSIFCFLAVLSCKETHSDPPDYIPPVVDVEVDSMVFAVIGDFGVGGSIAEAVSDLVKSWDPEFIITAGDNNYGTGDENSFRENIGNFYCDFIYNPSAPQGLVCEGQANNDELNRFFPSIGNNDYYFNRLFQPYADYFSLPGNEEFYDFKWGPVHFFSLNSSSSANSQCCESEQAEWLIPKLTESDKPFRIVYFHHSPYSEATHGNFSNMQWGFPELGATTVIAGHDHVYSALYRNDYPDVPYIICGSSGYQLYSCGENPLDPAEFDVFCYDDWHGAIRVETNSSRMVFQYFAINDHDNPIHEVVVEL
ncbi:MAG: metallophosphoesterase [Bacteroidota bacterium]